MSLIKQFMYGFIWAVIILSLIFGGGAYLDDHYKEQQLIERV